MGIGGHADKFIEINSLEDMCEIRRYVSSTNIQYQVIGKGSNILIDDNGFSGLIILNKIDFFRIEKPYIYTGGGTSFASLGAKSSRQNLSGLEFASGIPGSVGGAVCMNAGANKMETFDSLVYVGCVNKNGEYLELMKESIRFGYRYSSFQDSDLIIVSACFKLRDDSKASQRQKGFIKSRLSTQPYSSKSAGCIFKNPKSISAGKLIDSLGLKRFCVGDAQVSEMHGNFLINKKNARSKDFLALIALIQEKVYTKTSIKLETELKIINDKKIKNE